MAGKKHVQLTLESARKIEKGKHGGWRPGAGRPRKADAESHDARAEVRADIPLYVTLRFVDGLPSLATHIQLVRDAIKESQAETLRITEFNVLRNHLHLIAEARSKRELRRGIKALEARLARRLNSAMKRSGRIFAERYHARPLSTPAEVRYALRYVLLNRKHHAPDKQFARGWIDPWSSAMWFDGWAQPIHIDCGWMQALARVERPTVSARTWLLSIGWKQIHGPLDLDDRPADGRARAQKRARKRPG